MPLFCERGGSPSTCVETPEPGLGITASIIAIVESRGNGDGQDAESALDWNEGWFAVFPMQASNPIPLPISNIVNVVSDDTERRVVLDWYSPIRKGSRSSHYCKGAWSPDLDPANRRKPDRSEESMDDVCMTFSRLLRNNRIPQAVWDAVAEHMPPPESDSEMEDSEEKCEGTPSFP